MRFVRSWRRCCSCCPARVTQQSNTVATLDEMSPIGSLFKALDGQNMSKATTGPHFGKLVAYWATLNWAIFHMLMATFCRKYLATLQSNRQATKGSRKRRRERSGHFSWPGQCMRRHSHLTPLYDHPRLRQRRPWRPPTTPSWASMSTNCDLCTCPSNLLIHCLACSGTA